MKLSSIDTFFSCSFSSVDLSVIDFFKALCKGMGFNCINVSTASSALPPKKAREMIIDSQGIIVVATCRDRLSEGGFTMPHAVRDELLIAFALEKPCYVFVEEGVKIDGFLDKLSTYLSFNRDKLYDPGSIEKISAALTDFKNNVMTPSEIIIGHASYHSFYAEFVNMNLELKYNESGFIWENTVIRKLKFTDDFNYQLPFGMGCDVKLKIKDTDKAIDYVFEILDTNNIELKYNICEIRKDQQVVEYTVNFKPKPKKGDYIEILNKYSSPNLAPIFCEDMVSQRAEVVINKTPFFCHEGFMPIQHTNELVVTFDFPYEYGISENQVIPIAGAYFSKFEYPIESEIKRIKVSKATKGKFSIICEIKRPLLNHYYGIAWNPLKMDEWKRSKHQKNIIQDIFD